MNERTIELSKSTSDVTLDLGLDFCRVKAQHRAQLGRRVFVLPRRDSHTDDIVDGSFDTCSAGQTGGVGNGIVDRVADEN